MSNDSKLAQDGIEDLFMSNYSFRDIVKRLLERMTQEEIAQELEAFEFIANDSSGDDL